MPGDYIPGSYGNPGTAYAGLPQQYGLPTNFGYGPAIPGADLFNHALANMVGQLGQNVSGFTETPMADQAAGAYSGGEDQLMMALRGRGIGANPSLENALKGNYQQSMMGIPAAGTAAQTQFRQGQLQGLNQFPSAVAGNLANLQSAKLGNRAQEDANSRAFYQGIGSLIGDVGSIASPEFGSMRGFGSAIGQLSGRGGGGGAPGGGAQGGGPLNSALSGGNSLYNSYAPSGSPLLSNAGVPDWLAPYTAGATLV